MNSNVTLAKLKVLIVDDSLSMRMIITRALNELGIVNIVEATSGNHAWKALIEHNFVFDFIISDWSMAGGTGIDLLKKVRSHYETKSIPFVMCSAEVTETSINAAKVLGVTEYIEKPFTHETMLSIIKKHIFK